MTLSRLMLNVADAYWLDKVRAQNQLEAQKAQVMQRNELMDGILGRMTSGSAPVATPQAPDMSAPQQAIQSGTSGATGGPTDYINKNPELPYMAENSEQPVASSEPVAQGTQPQTVQQLPGSMQPAARRQVPFRRGSILDKFTPGSAAEFAVRLSGKDDILRNLIASKTNLSANAMDNATELQKAAMPKPTTDISNYKFAQQNPEFSDWLGDIKSKGSTKVSVNMGSKPVSVSDALKIVGPDGQHPIGKTYAEIANGEYVAQTTKEQEGDFEIDRTMDLVNTMDGMFDKIWGENGVIGGKTDFWSRLGDTAKANIEQYLQSRPEIVLYNDLAKGSISRILRAFGTVGALSDEDVGRGEGFVARVLPIPDTPEVARHKMKMLRKLLLKGYRNYLKLQNKNLPEEQKPQLAPKNVFEQKPQSAPENAVDWKPGDGPEPGVFWVD